MSDHKVFDMLASLHRDDIPPAHLDGPVIVNIGQPKHGMTEPTHRLFHDLWTNAVGTPGYNKKDWQKLEEILNRHGA